VEAKEIVAEEVARQAEFGCEPSWEDFVVAGQQAGIKKVVDAIKYPLVHVGESHPSSECPECQRQAQLREWGVK